MKKEIDKINNLKDELIHIMDVKEIITRDQVLDTLEVAYKNDLFDHKIFDLIDMCNKYISYYNEIDLDKFKPVSKNLSNEELIHYSREIIKKIDINLLDDFDKFIKSNDFKIYNKNLLCVSGLVRSEQTTYQDRDRDIVNRKISVVKDKNFSDISVIIHEFMHYTNSKNNAFGYFTYKFMDEYKIRNKYTEFISIFFERYAVSVLRDEFGIPNKYFDYEFRVKTNVRNCKDYIFNYLPFQIYNDYHDFNYELFCQTILDRGICIEPTRKNYEKCKKLFLKISNGYLDELQDYDDSRRNHPSLISLGRKEENVRKMMLSPVYDINYPLSTLLAIRLGNNNKDIVLELNSLLNEKVDDNFKNNPVIDKFEKLYDLMLYDNKVYSLIDEETKDIISSKSRGAL